METQTWVIAIINPAIVLLVILCSVSLVFQKASREFGGRGWGGELGGPAEVINEPENPPSKQQFDWTLLSEQFNSPPPPPRQAMAVRPYGKKTARPLLNSHKSRPLPASPSASHQLIWIKHTGISVPACAPLFSVCSSPLPPESSRLSPRLHRTKTSQQTKVARGEKK